jgi:uncharacterized protein (DUF433 family)
MSNHFASFETIIESVDALSPAELDALQARISRSRRKQTSTTKRPSERSVFGIPYDEYLAFSDAERETLQWRVYHEHQKWYEAELKARRAQWMIVCGGKIVESSKTLDDFPPPEKLQAMGKECGFIPFVFVPKPLIEESTWSALDEDDYYPTLTFSVAGKDQEESTIVNADLDTGSPHLFVAIKLTVSGQSESPSPSRQEYAAKISGESRIGWREKDNTGAWQKGKSEKAQMSIFLREFDRITFDPNVMGGRACIRGMRVTASLIVNLVANDMSTEEIIDAYPYLEPEDINQALKYAA